MSDALEVLDMPLGGSSLTAAAVSGARPEWFGELIRGREAWSAAGSAVARDFTDSRWVQELTPAFQATGAAAAMLRRAEQGALVVTTGQQPGLFGGPLYVLDKALAARALASAIERATGRCTVPVFWAATDDTDYEEARSVGIVAGGSHFERLVAPTPAEPGLPMSAMPLGDVRELLQRFVESSDRQRTEQAQHTFAAVERAYSADATVGGAYVALLRELFGPLGIPVLDASHPAVRRASASILAGALEMAGPIAAALSARTREIRAQNMRPQVADVESLSLVFRTAPDGSRARVPVGRAKEAARADSTELGPNVLLRPVVERAILPTVAYVGGPGEIAYFAQVSAVADTIGAARPRVVPRWAGTFVEPRVRDALDQLGATVEDVRDPHALETRVARASVAPSVRRSLSELRDAVDGAASRLESDAATDAPLARSVASMRAVIGHRITRLERRYAAMVKRTGNDLLAEAAIARANLFPAGAPQERVLGFVPFLARHGDDLIAKITAAADRHAEKIVDGG